MSAQGVHTKNTLASADMFAEGVWGHLSVICDISCARFFSRQILVETLLKLKTMQKLSIMKKFSVYIRSMKLGFIYSNYF